MKKLLPLIALLIALPVAAQEVRYYDVEIILFENLDPAARASEHWPESVELEVDDRTIEIGQPWPGVFPEEYAPKLTFKPLRTQEYQLTEQAAKIAESPSRRLLLHTGWRQPGMPQETALKVHFQRQIPAAPLPTVDEADPGTDNGQTLPPVAAGEAGELEGLIQVILARYLHVKADIVFRPERPEPAFDDLAPEGFQPLPTYPQPGTEPDDADITDERLDAVEPTAEYDRHVVYRMNQTRRRMRSRELHYLDHPVIGMLIRITPYEES